MRKKLVIAASAGVLTLSGLAVAVPALADPSSSTAAAGASAVERIRSALSGLVTDGSLTQEQADEVATTLDQAGLGSGHGGPGGGRLDLTAAAPALGMTETDLRTALQADGATLATVAEAQGVAVDTLVAALTDAEQTRIAAAVTDGRITQEQADERLAGLADRITERVNATDAGRHGGPGRRGGDRDASGEPAEETPAD